jgi:hypothetical protein
MYPSTENVVPGKRLGRLLSHDPRSRQFPYRPKTTTLVSAKHESHIGILDQGDLGSCFPPGVRVRMADGSERRIEEVRLLDRVVTAEGRTGRVMRTMVRDHEQGLVRVMLTGHAHLRMTRNHPVLTTRGYVPAGELVIGDEVALTKYQPSETTEAIVAADVLTDPSHLLPKGNRWRGVQGRSGLRVDANPLPEKLVLSESSGRLLGLFLAEGSADKSKVRWCFGSHEDGTLVAETVELLTREWGVTPHVQHRPNNSTFVTVYGTGWARLMSRMCGNGDGYGAGKKGPHAMLMSGSREFLAAMLDGWLAGDGHRRADGGQEGVTISADLALAMYDIAQSLGRRPVLDRRESPQNAYAKTRQPRWTVTMAAQSQARNKSHQDETHVWRRVRELRLEDYAGPVFNLEVEGDHSYVAEGVAVHNCTGNATVGALGCSPYYETLKTLLDGSLQLDEDEAVKIYSKATTLDDVEGTYPPDDTGSSGLAVAKAAKGFGLISGYKHAFSSDDALAALCEFPVIIGINWRTGCDNPDSKGHIKYTGKVRGGHEICLDEIDVSKKLVWFRNSWGSGWGDNGRANMSFADLDKALSDQGDATIFTALPEPPPQPLTVDEQLWVATKDWSNAPHSRPANVSAAKAIRNWAAAKGLD